MLIFVTRKLNSEELSQNLKKNDFECMSCLTFTVNIISKSVISMDSVA